MMMDMMMMMMMMMDMMMMTGLTPWPHLGPQEVLESVHTGKRMAPPPHCSKAL